MSKELKAVQYNQLQTQSQRRNPLTGDWIKNTEQLQIAKRYDHPRINTFDNAKMNQLLKVVGKWRVFIGVQNEAQPEELVMLTKFIHKEYGAIFSLPEIEDCIDLSVTGKLNVDAKPYNSFSPLYVSTILNAYIEYRNEKIAEIRKEQDRWEIEQKEAYKRSPEYALELLKEHIVSVFLSIESGKEFFDYGNVLSKWLVSTKRITVNDEERQNAKDFANKKIESEKELNTNSMKSGIRKNLIMSNPEDNFEMYYREYFTRKYFSKYKNVGEIIQTLSLKDVQ